MDLEVELREKRRNFFARDGGAWWAAVYGITQSWDTTEVT